MGGGELAQSTGAECSESETDHSLVVGIGTALDQVCGRRSVDESDGAVMSQQQRIGDIADGRAQRAVVAAYGEQQLVLRGCDTERRRLFLAPRQEPTQCRSEREQLSVFVIGEVVNSWRSHWYIVQRYVPA
jgi:hypothetical protein